MRIAVDVRSLLDGGHSGVEEYTRNIVQGLCDQAGLQVVGFYNSVMAPQLMFDERVELYSRGVPNKLLNVLQAGFAWPKWDIFLSELDCDVYFAPNFRLLPLSRDKALVSVVHDLSFERFPEFFSMKRRAWHALMRPRLLLENSDKIIAVSNATKRDIVELYDIDEKKVCVVYSGVSYPSGSLDSDPPLLTKERQGFVLFLGTLEPRKNIPTLIRAFGEIANDIDQSLVIAGLRGWLTSEIDASLRELPVSVRERIFFTGFVTQEQKWALYKNADLFVYPSFYEGFGFPPLEAFVSGTPVVTSYNSSLPEVVGGWATLINPYDISELALVMKEILLNMTRYMVSPADIADAHRRFSWAQAALETRDVLESIA